METREPNGTMTTLAKTTEYPLGICIDLSPFQWLLTYHIQYMWFIFILGFIENLFVISVFLFHKSRCTVYEIYLGNMATADLIFISSLPFWATAISTLQWPFGGFMCATVSSMFFLNLYSSIYFLMMVSIDRYLALVKIMSIGRLRRLWWAKVTCGIIWIFTALLSMPSIVFQKMIFIEELNITLCVMNPPSDWNIARNTILNVFGFLIPLVVTTFCTSQIICVLRNNAMRQFKKDNKERKATWLVLSVFFIFVVCWLPFNLSTFADTLILLHSSSCRVYSINHIVNKISFYFVLSNSCINPVIYCMVGSHFRQKAIEVYSRLLCKVRVSNR